MRIGVYFSSSSRTDGPDLGAVQAYAANLPGVDHVALCGPRPNPADLAREVADLHLHRIVIAGDSPGHLKPAFTRAMALAGADPAEVRLASFRAHGALKRDATDRAKAIVACATFGVPFNLAAVPEATRVHPATLIIGGGVAGIQAALEIADAGKQVYLVERTGTIGGHMAMFDKTFPTLDCAACILTPKMVAVGQHENISLLSYSEIQSVDGAPGAYRVKVLKRARRVDTKACVACNVCSDLCPVSVPSEFDAAIAPRKAIYIPFPQAVPNTFLVDGEACTFVQSGGAKCGACMKKCPKGCIDLNEQDALVELEVGNIILATGYEVLDPRSIERYGYGRYPDVLTALEFERLTNASGPTGGKIVTKTKRLNRRTKKEEWGFDPNGPSPRSVAIIHCVGSRDSNHNPYCSRVCCMYSLKFAHLVHEKLPDAACYEFYIDMRAFGKGYEEFADRIRQEGTFVVRGRSAMVCEKDGRMVVKGEDIVKDKVVEFPVDMVLLAVGLVPAHGTQALAGLLGLDRDRDGWFSELDYNGDPTDTERGGVYVAGVCQGPKDIPDTVAQASAVAAGVLRGIQSGKGLGSRRNLKLNQIEAQAQRLAGR